MKSLLRLLHGSRYAAAHADWHVQLAPATDAALALGMMHVIIRDEVHDADYIERYTVGFEQLCERQEVVRKAVGLYAHDNRPPLSVAGHALPPAMETRRTARS